MLFVLFLCLSLIKYNIIIPIQKNQEVEVKIFKNFIEDDSTISTPATYTARATLAPRRTAQLALCRRTAQLVAQQQQHKWCVNNKKGLSAHSLLLSMLDPIMTLDGPLQVFIS